MPEPEGKKCETILTWPYKEYEDRNEKLMDTHGEIFGLITWITFEKIVKLKKKTLFVLTSMRLGGK